MARPLRIEFPGAFYHVTARGNARQKVFLDDADCKAFLNVYAAVARRYNWVCHAYCLMTNHYHFVIETPEGNLAHGMRQLNGVYTQRFNRRHRRVGHVFQGRYNAILIERDSYLLELSRYVVLNPVRAGRSRRAQDWRWSSYRATAGLAPTPAWLETGWLLSEFSRQRQRAQAAYARFVTEGKKQPPIWNALRHQIYLGTEAFVQRLQRKINASEDLSEIPRAQRRPAPKPLSHYERQTKDPKLAMARAHAVGGYTLKEVAQHFGVHYSTVSRAVRMYEKG